MGVRATVIVAGACCLGALVDIARGNDDATAGIPPALELPAGGLIFAARERLLVDSETLTIALDRIEIDYRLRSTVTRVQTIAMAFPLPVIDMGNLDGSDLAIPAFDPTNPTNFVGYWTTLDGIPVEPDVTQRAYAIGHIDVTELLRRYGLPLYPLDPALAEKLRELAVDAKQELEHAGAVDLATGTPAPQWSLRTVFHWRHALVEDGNLAIRHHYKPVPGSAAWSAELKTKAQTKFCMSDTDVAALDARATAGRAPTVYWVSYAPGSNSWNKGASLRHTLTVERPDAKGIAATCAPGQRIPTERGFAIATTNRIDDVDIEVMFVE